MVLRGTLGFTIILQTCQLLQIGILLADYFIGKFLYTHVVLDGYMHCLNLLLRTCLLGGNQAYLFYRKQDIYTVDWANKIDLRKFHVAAASSGGPIGNKIQ